MTERDRDLFETRACKAASMAQQTGTAVVASLTVAVDVTIDPSAVVLDAAQPCDRRFCFERPADDGFALAALGECAVIDVAVGQSMGEIARACADLVAGALFDDPLDDPAAPLAAGPVWVGGFAFDVARTSPGWERFGAGRKVLPRLSIARRAGEARLTLNCRLGAGDDAREAVQGALALVAGLNDARLPLLDPSPVQRSRVTTAAPPEHYLGAIRRATDRIDAGEMEKIVIARELTIDRFGEPVGAVLANLRGRFADCYCFVVGYGDQAFVGASPELLLRREGRRVSTMALAGSARRATEPAVDEHLGRELMHSTKDQREHAIVVRGIERTLGAHSAWVATTDRPELVRLTNIQHLATPIRAQLLEPRSAIELAAMLHPTPAVGGEPWSIVREMIPALEGIERGWYAGPVGWSNLLEDGEYCVALRSALIVGDKARLFAGVGVVADSDPADELAETETKFAALLPAFAP